MNEDLYATGSAVGLYRLFTFFFEIPWEIPKTGWILWGGRDVLGITGPSPSYPSFFTLLSIKTIRDHQRGDYT